jgi:hypothetical protein
MYTSSSSIISSSSTTLGRGIGSSGILSEYTAPAISDTADDVASSFSKLLEDYQSVSADPRSVRRAACCAALAETAREQRGRRRGAAGNDDDDDDDHAPVTPNEMFVVAIAALTSLQTSLESRQKSLSSSAAGGGGGDDDANNDDAVAESIVRELEGTAIPVLELLRRILPYVAHRTNNSGVMLSHQFGTISRMLRLFVAMGYALPAAAAATGGEGSQKRTKKGKYSSSSSRLHQQQQRRGAGEVGAGVSGANALLRQVLKVSTTLLLIAPPVGTASGGTSEKDLARLLHSTIVPMFHDLRPKVRKAAWGSAMEIIVVASSSSSSSASSCTSLVGGDDDADTNGVIVVARRIQRQRRVVADFLWEYCHAVVSKYSSSGGGGGGKSSKEISSKVIHVLRFLSSSLPYADDSRIRVRFGEICQSTLAEVGGGGGSLEVVKEIIMVLLSCLETSEREQESHEDDTAAAKGGDGETSNFASRCLAFLLQHRPSGANDPGSHDGVDDVNAVYGRCLLACVERMLGRTANDDGGGHRDDVPASILLAMKLIPNVLTSMLNICEASCGSAKSNGRGTGGNGDGSDHYDSSGSAFNRFVSQVIPIVVSYLDRRNTNNVKLHRVSLETLPLCIPIIQRALQIQYRSAWGSILTGGYATFTLTLARHLLERRLTPSSSSGTASNVNDDDPELNDQLFSWLRALVLSLLRLHDDVAKGGGAARTAVEYATSTIIRGMGVELFIGLVDFVDEDGDGGGTKKEALSSSSTTGGGIRDDRAWLLPLMKQSVAVNGSSSVTTNDITSKTHLSFFQGNVLNLARKCDAASADGHRTVAEASIQKARVVELWSLLPIFCVYPLDVKENFGSVAKTMVKALGDHGRYPKLIVSIVCRLTRI